MNHKDDKTSTGNRSASYAQIPAWRAEECFFDRPSLALERANAAQSPSGKRILITGAGGWIGSALTRAIAGAGPKHIVLLEAAERNLYEIDAALRESSKPVSQASIVGSVSDPVLLNEVFRCYQPQIVYHAAAFKHVPLMEQNPFAAIENNVLGTGSLVRAATRHGAEQLILVSTDKAVDPVSIMGASKRIAELILLAGRTPSTRMKAVRLGNVFGSEGSIVPLFLRQILSGGPVTVTHPEARRYFLSIEDAVTLLLFAASTEVDQGILVPELGEPVLVQTVARQLIAGVPGSSASPPAIVFTQLRPGDKMCEALLSSRESYVAHAGPTPPLRAVCSPAMSAAVLDEILMQLKQACKKRSLELLLAAIMRAVPEYRPSAIMQSALPAGAGITP